MLWVMFAPCYSGHEYPVLRSNARGRVNTHRSLRICACAPPTIRHMQHRARRRNRTQIEAQKPVGHCPQPTAQHDGREKMRRNTNNGKEPVWKWTHPRSSRNRQITFATISSFFSSGGFELFLIFVRVARRSEEVAPRQSAKSIVDDCQSCHRGGRSQFQPQNIVKHKKDGQE
jgi:hypothetical protein